MKYNIYLFANTISYLSSVYINYYIDIVSLSLGYLGKILIKLKKVKINISF